MQLPLDDQAISTALDIHEILFLRSFEILKSLMVERASFETFAVWLSMMAEDVLADEDSNPDPPPLHTIDTEAVAKYITTTFPNPILGNFVRDLAGEGQGEMDVDWEEGYLAIIRGWTYSALIQELMSVMKEYFRKAAGELRGGVSWVLDEWFNLEIHDEIAASDMHMVTRVLGSYDSGLTVRMVKRVFSLQLQC